MRLSLELVVIAIIIVVVAVVVLSIFGGGIGQFGTATNARSNCINQGKWSCQATGVKPTGWDKIPVFSQGNVEKTCAILAGSWENCCIWQNNVWEWQSACE